MGNSEVGHNALGAGRVYAQGAKLVNEAIAGGSLFDSETWQWLVEPCVREDRALHLLGLLSDGNVHSHIDHLFALIKAADRAGVRRVNVHALLDGRDVPRTPAQLYIQQLEDFLASINESPDRRYRIASGGGRMNVTMDRYFADWSVVKRGWDAHVRGVGRPFGSAMEALETYRAENPGLLDQFMPEFVVVEDGTAVGRIQDGDGVVLFNFRGDRAIEITMAFESAEFDHFDRVVTPDVRYAGMMQYDGDLRLPSHYLVSPPSISRTMGEYLARNKVNLRIQKGIQEQISIRIRPGLPAQHQNGPKTHLPGCHGGGPGVV
jgi:2,3-bisphosphoglycerate-independent phosphoglycerate mutase